MPVVAHGPRVLGISLDLPQPDVLTTARIHFSLPVNASAGERLQVTLVRVRVGSGLGLGLGR